MHIFFQFIFIFIIYMIILPVVYYITEIKGLPKWLDFKPFICRLCLSFWTMLAASLVIGLSFQLWWYMTTGIILAVFTAIAMYIDQKEKTVSIEDLNNNGTY